jgi:putative Mn2+ efflux pump MntP
MFECILEYIMNEIPRDYINVFHILFVSFILMYFGVVGSSTLRNLLNVPDDHITHEFAFILLAGLGLFVLIYHCYSYLNNDDHSLY